METKKRKSGNRHNNLNSQISKKKKVSRKNDKNGEARKKTGPRLPNALRKEIENMNAAEKALDSDEFIDSDDARDLFEVEEATAEEESKKNRRYDPIVSLEYELPDQFEDENVASDDDSEDDMDVGYMNGSREKQIGDLSEEESDENVTSDDDNNEDMDDGRHSRMLQEITGLPSEAFEGKKRKNDVVISEAYPESEYNPSRDVLDGDGRISIQDLLDPLQRKSGFSKLRKNVQRIERESKSTQAPLPKPDREKVERKVTYEQSKKDISKWGPLVKRNREAPTRFFNEDVDLEYSTIGAIASEFEPRTEFEKKMAPLYNNREVLEAHNKDGARLLAMNKISVEDVIDRENRLAKMRSLLFHHEVKAKRIKKIKSKTFHRLLKKDRLKAAEAVMGMDPEAAKELAMKQEFKRAEERMTMKHKNSSKWAKRILKRGLDVQDDGTRAAISEQLHQHALLTRKMNSTRDSTSSDDSSDEYDSDENASGSDQDGASKLLEKAKEKTLKVIDNDDEMPKSGLLSLPFMVRGLEKRKEAANEEAKIALEEYESSLKQLEDKTDAESLKKNISSGRRVFGAPKQQVQESNNTIRSDNYFGNSDSDDNLEDKEDKGTGHYRSNNMQRDVNIDPDLLREKSEVSQDPVIKSFEALVNDPRPKTTYEVAIFAPDSLKKMKNPPNEDHEQMKSKKGVDASIKKSSRVGASSLHDQDIGEVGDDSETESEGHMVDGILSSGTKSTYKLPSQADLIHRAFAGDDVEDDFEKEKEDILNEEIPEPEKPVLLPGWGQWTRIQQKKGPPSWMLEEHKAAQKKRDEALKKRKDAHLKHVVISEKFDKKAEKLFLKKLPYPYTSNEVYEQSIRMPLGPDFNPASTVGALNRPEVVKKAGVIINPIKFEEVNTHEKAERSKRRNRRKKVAAEE